VWTFTVLSAYLVWYVPSLRKPWVVPDTVMTVEYGLVLLATAWLIFRLRASYRSSLVSTPPEA
jgi:hypothetical protein